jgi:hypothetical protein
MGTSFGAALLKMDILPSGRSDKRKKGWVYVGVAEGNALNSAYDSSGNPDG